MHKIDFSHGEVPTVQGSPRFLKRFRAVEPFKTIIGVFHNQKVHGHDLDEAERWISDTILSGIFDDERIPDLAFLLAPGCGYFVPINCRDRHLAAEGDVDIGHASPSST